MIHRLDLPGVTYVENLPDGTWAGLYAPAFPEHTSDDHIQTNLGRIDLHEGAWPLYLRITKEGGFQLAGQASDGGGTLHYAHGYWSRDPRISYGVSGHIFDSGGNLRIIEAAPHQTTQGYRYESEGGVLVRGDETYSDPGRRISEFTTYGDLTIGQGWQGGCLAIRGELRVILEPGHVSFIRFARWGDTCAVALWKQQERKAVLLWFHVADLVSFPPEPTAVPDPGPIVPIPSTPPDPPRPSMQIPSHAWQVVQQLHARFAATLPATEDGAREFTRMCAEQCAFAFPQEGWCSKSGDPTRPPTKDNLCRQFQGRFEGWDILSAAGANGPRVLAENPSYYDLSGQHAIPVIPTNHLGLPAPMPVPEPGGDADDPGDSDPPRPPDTELLKRMDAFERRLQRLETAGLLVAQTFKP